MCGIAGKIQWKGGASVATVSAMCANMLHRGPDDSGILNLGNITLGHRRLSIIDLSRKARQPMICNTGRYAIVYNGEVYNFQILKAELQKSGFVFGTASDTEVVLYAYIHWGTKCLNKFNGMFAFAVWDNQNQELFMARDRFGKKPLYYYMDSSQTVFASELTALVCDTTLSRTFSQEALNCYLALGYILAPMTLYKDIYKLEPATYMLISHNGSRVLKNRYWHYADAFRTKTNDNKNDCVDNVLSLLREAVKRRMVSDVPIGAFLSGGIDSSAVSGIMKSYHTGDMHTFSMGFDNAGYSEANDAERAARSFGTIHHSTTCLAKGADSLMHEAVSAYDEPFSDTSLIPTVELAKFTAAHVTVALSGDGADEIFAGYITYKADFYYRYARLLPSIIKKMMAAAAVMGTQKISQKLGWRYRMKQFSHGCMHSPEKAHYSWRLLFHPEERIAILGEGCRELVYDTDPLRIFQNHYKYAADLHWLDRHLYVDGMTWLPDDILFKIDRASMHNSLEVRCPFLDVDLVSYVAALPPHLKLHGTQSKYILKKALKGIVPDFVLTKKKSGFNAPVGAWLGYAGIDEFKAFNRYVFNLRVSS